MSYNRKSEDESANWERVSQTSSLSSTSQQVQEDGIRLRRELQELEKEIAEKYGSEHPSNSDFSDAPARVKSRKSEADKENLFHTAPSRVFIPPLNINGAKKDIQEEEQPKSGRARSTSRSKTPTTKPEVKKKEEERKKSKTPKQKTVPQANKPDKEKFRETDQKKGAAYALALSMLQGKKPKASEHDYASEPSARTDFSGDEANFVKLEAENQKLKLLLKRTYEILEHYKQKSSEQEEALTVIQTKLENVDKQTTKSNSGEPHDIIQEHSSMSKQLVEVQRQLNEKNLKIEELEIQIYDLQHKTSTNNSTMSPEEEARWKEIEKHMEEMLHENEELLVSVKLMQAQNKMLKSQIKAAENSKQAAESNVKNLERIVQNLGGSLTPYNGPQKSIEKVSIGVNTGILDFLPASLPLDDKSKEKRPARMHNIEEDYSSSPYGSPRSPRGTDLPVKFELSKALQEQLEQALTQPTPLLPEEPELVLPTFEQINVSTTSSGILVSVDGKGQLSLEEYLKQFTS